MNVSTDIKKLQKQLKGREDSLHFGLSDGLRWTVQGCKKKVVEYTQKSFDRPKRQTANAYGTFWPSLKQVVNTTDFRAGIFMYDWAAEFLLLYEDGGTMEDMLRLGYVAYPVNLDLDQWGNVTALRERDTYRTLYDAASRGEDDYFLIHHDSKQGHLPSGVYERQPDNKLKMIFGIDDSRPLTNHFKYHEFVARCFREDFPRKFEEKVQEHHRRFVQPIIDRL